MLALKILLILLEIICALLLIGVILLQKTKGEGLGLAFGAEMGESIFGARASNVLVKITIWLGAFFLLNTIMLATLYSKGARKSLLSERMPPPVEQPGLPQPATPQMPQTPAPIAAPAALPQASTPQAATPRAAAPSAPAETTPGQTD